LHNISATPIKNFITFVRIDVICSYLSNGGDERKGGDKGRKGGEREEGRKEARREGEQCYLLDQNEGGHRVRYPVNPPN
jgi:hypothetical protein